LTLGALTIPFLLLVYLERKFALLFIEPRERPAQGVPRRRRGLNATA
jgi:hypothetical protein